MHWILILILSLIAAYGLIWIFAQATLQLICKNRFFWREGIESDLLKKYGGKPDREDILKRDLNRTLISVGMISTQFFFLPTNLSGTPVNLISGIGVLLSLFFGYLRGLQLYGLQMFSEGMFDVTAGTDEEPNKPAMDNPDPAAS